MKQTTEAEPPQAAHHRPPWPLTTTTTAHPPGGTADNDNGQPSPQAIKCPTDSSVMHPAGTAGGHLRLPALDLAAAGNAEAASD